MADTSYDFDGTNDYIDLGDPDILDLSYSNYTYSLWFRTDATTDNYYILSKYQTYGANAFGIGTTGEITFTPSLQVITIATQLN